MASLVGGCGGRRRLEHALVSSIQQCLHLRSALCLSRAVLSGCKDALHLIARFDGLDARGGLHLRQIHLQCVAPFGVFGRLGCGVLELDAGVQGRARVARRRHLLRYLAHAAGGRGPLMLNDRSLSVRSVLSERVQFIDALNRLPQIVVAVIERRQTLRKASDGCLACHFSFACYPRPHVRRCGHLAVRPAPLPTSSLRALWCHP